MPLSTPHPFWKADDIRLPTRVVVCLIYLFVASTSTVTFCEQNQDSHFIGSRTTIVQLFEWRWNDIARECEEFLGPKKFAGVQVSPPNENAVFVHPSRNGRPFRTWDERYQPVSYKLASYSGSRQEFINMVKKCNESQVRVYVDVVFNHMTADIGQGSGFAGSKFDSEILTYEGVPYDTSHFNSRVKCGTPSGEIEDFGDVNQIRNCRYRGRADLDQSQESVRSKISAYLNDLISLGVAGFRVDAAAYMRPEDLKDIYGKLSHLNTDYFPPGKRPFIYQEVFDPRLSQEYSALGRVAGITAGKQIANIFLQVVDHEKLCNQHIIPFELRCIRKLTKDLPNPHESLLYLDDHETQRGLVVPNPDEDVLTYRDRKRYVLANVFLLAQPHGIVRIMSSYLMELTRDDPYYNRMHGPPSLERPYQTLPVVKVRDFQCKNGWICEHRWREIYGMVGFRNAVGDAPLVNWWDNGGNAIAFSRERKGFVVMSNDSEGVNEIFNTTLPRGVYCNVITGHMEGSHCTGRNITVGKNGFTRITIGGEDISAVVLHVGSFRVDP